MSSKVLYLSALNVNKIRAEHFFFHGAVRNFVKYPVDGSLVSSSTCSAALLAGNPFSQ